MAAPDRLAWQRQDAKAQLGHALHLGEGALEVARGQRRRRRHPLHVGPEGLPRPVVPHAALGLGEDRIGGGPHREALVGKDHLGVDAVAILIAQAIARIGARLLPRHVLTLEIAQAQPVGPMPLGDAPLHALVVGDHARHAVLVLLVDPVRPEARRLIGVAIRGDDEVLVGRAGPGRACPPSSARAFEAPAIRLVDDDIVRGGRAHEVLHWTSV